jgi:hypothetical protein
MVAVWDFQTLPQRSASVRGSCGAIGPSGGVVEPVLTGEIVVAVNELTWQMVMGKRGKRGGTCRETLLL